MAARKLLKFLILFDNTNLLYFPGQFLSGRVLVELEDDTPALGNVANTPLGQPVPGTCCVYRRYKLVHKKTSQTNNARTSS
jgi:hypothetical protein